jgi:hypothetical protein
LGYAVFSHRRHRALSAPSLAFITVPVVPIRIA